MEFPVIDTLKVFAARKYIQQLNSPYEWRRKKAAIALGKLKDPRAIPVLTQVLQDRWSSNVRCAAAEALGKIGNSQALPALITALQEDKSARAAIVEALGRIGDPQAIPALTTALQEAERESARAAIVEALGEIGDPQAIPVLTTALQNESEYIRHAAAKALGKIGNSQAISALTTALQDKLGAVRYAAVQALGEIGDPQALTALTTALKVQDGWGDVRSAAAKALGQIGWISSIATEQAFYYVAKPQWSKAVKLGVAALPALTTALQNKNEYTSVRSAAAKALGKIGDPQAIPVLITALKVQEGGGEVHRAAVKALKQLNWKPSTTTEQAAYYIAQGQWNKVVKLGHDAIPALTISLQEWPGAAAWALAALARIGPAASPALISALKDTHQYVRRAAAEALDQLGWKPNTATITEQAFYYIAKDRWKEVVKLGCSALPALITTLQDKNGEVRRAAAGALGQIGNSQALPALTTALQDRNEHVRRAAAEALGQIGDPQAISSLIQVLHDRDVSVCCAAAGALGQIGNSQALPALTTALQDRNEHVRRAAAGALGQIGDPQAISSLIQVLHDRDVSVCCTAAEALGQIGDPRAIPALTIALQNVRAVASAALVKIGPASIPALTTALQHKCGDVRRTAAWALDQIGWTPSSTTDEAFYYVANLQWDRTVKLGSVAIPALITALQDKYGDKYGNVPHATAANALVKIGPASIPALIATLQHKWGDVRHASAGSLDQLGWKPTTVTEQAFYYVAKLQWNRVVKLGSPAIPALMNVLQDEEESVRAVEALGRIGDPQAIPVLEDLLSHTPSTVVESVPEYGGWSDRTCSNYLYETLDKTLRRLRKIKSRG
ncbi:HEAT repeat domain-containing protein [Candidatus Poribacteria bacterium]|nr:HEAT repeat domain-containing protein [Candidatus Poribacteria bacterium]